MEQENFNPEAVGMSPREFYQDEMDLLLEKLSDVPDSTDKEHLFNLMHRLAVELETSDDMNLAEMYVAEIKAEAKKVLGIAS